MAKKTKEQIQYNMRQVRNKNTAIENILCKELQRRGIKSFKRNDKMVYGKPDVVFTARKLAIFCDGDFWHGYNWNEAKNEIKSNRDFWIQKIEKNIARDGEVDKFLLSQGWNIKRFWGHEIKKNVSQCVDVIEEFLHDTPELPYKTIDLCAGIGGIRRGFELTGLVRNVLSAEIDTYACKTYKHLFGDDANHDLTSNEFKELVEQTEYDILLAGFPCQTFSRVGLGEGFNNEEKGQIFFHIADIIQRTRPRAFFLENVDRLVTHNNGETFKQIIETLVEELNYHIVGVSCENEKLRYDSKTFIRNSRDFGVPQNRPRTYIIGFDKERYSRDNINKIPLEMPLKREKSLYSNLNDILEKNVEPNYYMASGYWETLKRHRQRQEKKGYGFGYRIVNESNNKNPIANTLLATGGSGKERNLIYDPKKDIAGMKIKGKKTPLNSEGIRVMTPTEWGKLQGFINYGFMENGEDKFSFPDGVSNIQKYKQFGNSVTIPVIEEMAKFMMKCFEILSGDNKEGNKENG